MKHKNSLTQLPDGGINVAFDADLKELTLDQIVPLKVVTAHLQESVKFRQIVSSIREVGIIEPPVVVPEGKSRYILLDGHLRVQALKELGIDTVTCLISSDDEGFTYNKYVNRISPIQEHRMIRRAVERGVHEEKIAKALNVDVHNIVLKRNMLDGICAEAVEMLKDKMVAVHAFPILKRMKPYRQIEAVTLMNDANTYSTSYARALRAATPKDQMVHPEKPKKIRGLSDEQMARMENEMATLQREFRLIEESYGTDNLNLTYAKGYLGRLLGNARAVRYLAQHQNEMLREFQKLVDMKSLGDGEAT